LRDDFHTFFFGKGRRDFLLFSRGHVHITPLAYPLPQEFSEENFRELQTEVKSILNTMIDWRNPGTLRQKSIHIQKRYTVIPCDHMGLTGQNMIHIHGPTRDMFLEALFLLLQEDTERIRRCPECDKLFYRVRKQQFCSRQCTNRANVRTWRQREEVKAQER